MIVAVLSDIHANLPALEQFIRTTTDRVDSYLCLGDVVDYGPWNDECLELLHSLPGLVLIEGNHERLFLGLDPIEDEHPLVREFYDHSFRCFRRADLIRGLPPSYALGSFVCAHTIDNRKVYADTELQVTRDYLIGHTHHQYRIQRSGRLVLNCGSIGQNRACIDTLNYALYDTESGHVSLCREPYPFDQFIRELEARRYSRRCIEYYLNKRRQ